MGIFFVGNSHTQHKIRLDASVY